MENIAQQRCFNHALREAAARCPECGHCYCRECVTEHQDRVVCTSCLKRLAAAREEKRPILRNAVRLSQVALGVLTLWLCFYFLGRSLLAIPASFHEGTLWKPRPEANP